MAGEGGGGDGDGDGEGSPPAAMATGEGRVRVGATFPLSPLSEMPMRIWLRLRAESWGPAEQAKLELMSVQLT